MTQSVCRAFVFCLFIGLFACVNSEENKCETTTVQPGSLPTLQFGEDKVNVYTSDEVRFDNGTITRSLDLSNGIKLHVELFPIKTNDITSFATTGEFSFRTPDSFTYFLEFKADPENFNVITFERRRNFLPKANPKILAALAGQ